MLEAGSSRVFDCIETHRKLRADGAADTRFFRHEPLHNVVIIKEVRTGGEGLMRGRNLLTKLYIPYNENDVYEGGRSVFFTIPSC